MGASRRTYCSENVATVVYRAGPAPSNIPELVSELIGRDRELAEIQSLAARRRLVTLTGPGGIGKTRLALQSAPSARQRPVRRA